MIPVSLVLRSPALDSALQMCSFGTHQGWAETKDYLPWPTGNILPNALWDTVFPLCTASSWSRTSPPGLPGLSLQSCHSVFRLHCCITLPRCKTWHLHFWTSWYFCQPFLWPIKVPVKSSTTIWFIHHFDTFPGSYHLWSCWGCSVASSMSLVKKPWYQSLGYAARAWHLNGIGIITALWAQFSQLSILLTCFLIKSIIHQVSIRISWEAASKALLISK